MGRFPSSSRCIVQRAREVEGAARGRVWVMCLIWEPPLSQADVCASLDRCERGGRMLGTWEGIERNNSRKVSYHCSVHFDYLSGINGSISLVAVAWLAFEFRYACFT